MASGGGGESVVAFFRRLGVPNAEALKPDDLDWMLENVTNVNSDEQASLLAFLTSGKVGHLSAEKNVLTDSELDRWSEMQKTNPEMILSGELLDQALQLVKEDDPEEISGGCGRDLDQLTDQELESLVAERRDLLQAQEIEVEQSEKLLEAVNRSRSDLRVQMMRLEERERHLESEVVSRQQRVLHIDQKRQASVNDINQQIAHLVNVLDKQAGAESKTSPFLSSTNLDAVIAADTEVRNEIESLARSQLERRSDKRSLEDKLKIAAESNHLVKAFQTSEGQRLMRKAELKSAQAATKEIEHQTSRIQEMSSSAMEESSLLNMIRDLEVTVANIDTEMTNLSKGDLAKHLQAKSQNYLTKIQHLEADADIKRKEACESVMKMVIDLLQHQVAYQEMLSLLLEHQWKGLKEFKVILERVGKNVETEKENEAKAESRAKEISDTKSRLSRKTLQPEDKTLEVLVKLLNSGVDPNILTVDEVLKTLSDFHQKLEASKRDVKETEERWQSQRQHVEEAVRAIHKQLQIDDLNRGGVLVRPEITKKIQEVEIKLRDYERTVKVKIQDLEREKKELKGHAMLGVRRQLGKDLMELVAS